MPSRLAAFAMTFGIAALMVYALVTGRDLLIPFAIAVMVWYLINALKRGVQRWAHAPGWLALTVAILALIALIGLVVEIISGNIAAVGDAAPAYQANVEKLIAKAMKVAGLEQMPTIGQVVEQFDLRTMIKAVAGAAANVAGNAGLIVIYVMFLLIEQSTFDRKIDALFPEKEREQMVHEVLADIQQRIQTYVAVKTGLSLATGAISYFIMLAVGLDLAGFWAFLIFLLNYIPTIGSLLGVVFPSLLAIIQFGDVVPFLVVVVGLGLCQVAIGNVIEPKLMGKSLNVSSLVVIVSLAVWGSIWGVTGMFLCVPITVILMIVLAEFKQTRPVAILLSADGKV